MKKLSSQLGYWVIWLSSLTLPTTVSAEINTKEAIQGTLTFDTTDTSTDVDISTIIDQVIIIILYIVGVAAILYLIFSGLQYITAGGDDEKSTKGRKGVINAVIGIIIVMAAWFIFRASVNVGQNISNVSQAL